MAGDYHLPRARNSLRRSPASRRLMRPCRGASASWSRGTVCLALGADSASPSGSGRFLLGRGGVCVDDARGNTNGRRRRRLFRRCVSSHTGAANEVQAAQGAMGTVALQILPKRSTRSGTALRWWVIYGGERAMRCRRAVAWEVFGAGRNCGGSGGESVEETDTALFFFFYVVFSCECTSGRWRGLPPSSSPSPTSWLGSLNGYAHQITKNWWQRPERWLQTRR